MGRLRLLSLFSGIGAFEKALDNLNIKYELVNYCEIDKYASKAYSAIHSVSEDKNLGDVRTIDTTKIHDIDLLTFGFPCTDISVAGTRKGLVDGDGNKTRSGLVFDAFKIIEDTQPKVAIAENVLNLVATSFKDIFNHLVTTLEQLGVGYNVYWQVLAANDYGIPQIRRRVFMIAIRKDVDDGEFRFPSPIPLRGVLADYLEDNPDPKYTMSEQIKITFSDMTNRNGYVRGTIWQPHDLRTSKMAFTITTRQGSVPDQNYIIVGEPVYKEVVSDEINIFDTPTTEIDWTKTVVRKLTPLEAFRLMGFSDKDYDAVRKAGISNAQMYKMTGNSIVVPVVQHIINNLTNYIGGK